MIACNDMVCLLLLEIACHFFYEFLSWHQRDVSANSSWELEVQDKLSLDLRLHSKMARSNIDSRCLEIRCFTVFS